MRRSSCSRKCVLATELTKQHVVCGGRRREGVSTAASSETRVCPVELEGQQCDSLHLTSSRDTHPPPSRRFEHFAESRDGRLNVVSYSCVAQH